MDEFLGQISRESFEVFVKETEPRLHDALSAAGVVAGVRERLLGELLKPD